MGQPGEDDDCFQSIVEKELLTIAIITTISSTRSGITNKIDELH